MDKQSIGAHGMKTAHKKYQKYSNITAGRDSFGTNIIYMRQSCIMKSHK